MITLDEFMNFHEHFIRNMCFIEKCSVVIEWSAISPEPLVQSAPIRQLHLTNILSKYCHSNSSILAVNDGLWNCSWPLMQKPLVSAPPLNCQQNVKTAFTNLYKIRIPNVRGNFLSNTISILYDSLQAVNEVTCHRLIILLLSNLQQRSLILSKSLRLIIGF